MKNKKNLPIRVFQKREIDSRETEGGGSGDPSWVLSGEMLRNHSKKLKSDFQKIDNYIVKQRLDDNIPIPIIVDISEKAIAKSHRNDIEKLFIDDKNNFSTIGFSPNNELMFLVNNQAHSKRIDSSLKRAEQNKKGISAIKKIKKYKPYIEKNINLEDAIKIKLIDYRNDFFKNYVHKTFKDFCKGIGVGLKEHQYTNDLKVYRANIVSKDSLKSIESFDGIFSVESMPKYSFTYDQGNLSKKVTVKKPIKLKDYPKIGLLDSGISDIAHLSPWICGKISPYTDDLLNTSHGTFVAGILIYGDELIDQKVVDSDGCHIFDAPVISDLSFGPIEEGELIDNIREIIKVKKEEIKIWSLSLGTEKQASLHYFSDFGIALDEVQEENNVLILKSAGNCTNYQQSKPPSRISISADSVRSIVVGSIAHNKCQTDLADINCLSPFSRIGPGPQYIVKPDLVHYGGNSGLSDYGMPLKNGVFSFGNDGKITCDCGTSFSTPRVSALAAELNHNLTGDFERILLKTLIVHTAKYPSPKAETPKQQLNKYGFGLPTTTGNIIYNDDYEITVLLKDELPKGQFIEILDFPFPENLLNHNGYYRGIITVTLVNDCLLDRTQGKEYCQSDLEVSFGTYDHTVKRDTSKPIIKNPIGRKNPKNILNKNCYSKRLKNDTNSFFKREPLLIQNGKFHPIKKFVCDLENMTKTNKDKYLKSPKKWYLKVKGVYRQNIERKADELGIDIKNNFCIAITIRDPMRTEKVYNNVSQLLTRRNFHHNQLGIRQDIKVQVGNI